MTIGNLRELTCKELVELATEYLSQALPAEEAVQFERHLGTCPGCTVYLEQLKNTIALAGGLDKGALSSDAERTLLALFQRWKQKSSP